MVNVFSKGDANRNENNITQLYIKRFQKPENFAALRALLAQSMESNSPDSALVRTDRAQADPLNSSRIRG
jgi:hypothetical protein